MDNFDLGVIVKIITKIITSRILISTDVNICLEPSKISKTNVSNKYILKRS